MANKFKCQCGSTKFEIVGIVHDQLLFEATVYEDGSVDTLDVLKDYPGDTDLEDIFECCQCHEMHNLAEITERHHRGRCVEI